jgi:hypothetical protein
MSASHQPALLKLTQVAIHRCQAHGSWPSHQTAMQLLATHLIKAGFQCIQQLFLACIQPWGGIVHHD